MGSRVLIISHNALSLHSNNGKTLSSLFGDWEKSEIAQIYFQDEIPESLVFHKFFRVRDLDVLKSAILFFDRSRCGEIVYPRGNVVSHYEDSSRFKLFFINFLRNIGSFKIILRDFIYGTGLWFSRDLENWLKDFRPNSVFFVGGNYGFSFKIALFISSKLGVPLDVFITDDYLLNVRPGFIGERLRKQLHRIYREVFSVSRHVFVIGDDMASAFSDEFNREFIPVMNTVDLPNPMPKVDVKLKSKGLVDVVYAGGLHLGREESIVKFAELAKSAADSLGLEFSLTVYSMQQPSRKVSESFASAGVKFGGGLSHNHLPLRLQQADFVLHVESFDDKYVQLTKLSVSTKIPEYLTSGACVIAYGPASLSSIRLINTNSVGVCLTDLDDDSTALGKLVEIFCSEELRTNYCLRSFALAREKFDGLVVRNRFNSLLN